METRRAARFERRFKITIFAIPLVALVAFLATVRLTHSFLAVSGVFLVAGVWLLFAVARALLRFPCPQCGRLLPRPVDTGDQRRAPLVYPCTRCDVQWDTGLRTTDDWS